MKKNKFVLYIMEHIIIFIVILPFYHEHITLYGFFFDSHKLMNAKRFLTRFSMKLFEKVIFHVSKTET